MLSPKAPPEKTPSSPCHDGRDRRRDRVPGCASRPAPSRSSTAPPALRSRNHLRMTVPRRKDLDVAAIAIFTRPRHPASPTNLSPPAAHFASPPISRRSYSFHAALGSAAHSSAPIPPTPTSRRHGKEILKTPATFVEGRIVGIVAVTRTKSGATETTSPPHGRRPGHRHPQATKSPIRIIRTNNAESRPPHRQTASYLKS